MIDAQPTGDATCTLIRWGAANDLVRVMLITSARAIPGARMDILSDYDVILVVQDVHPFVDDHTWLADFGDVLVVYWDPLQPDPVYNVETSGNVTQFADGLKIDFKLWPVDVLRQIVAAPVLTDELDAGYQVLLDKDGLTEGLHLPTYKAYVPQPPSHEAYLVHINDFLTDAPYVAKCLWRDELLPAKWCLDTDMKLTYLRQMLEWLVGIDEAWSAPVGFLGKGLKTRLDPELWSRVEQTFAGASIVHNWAALERTVALFREVSIEVGASLGYAYPETLHRRVMDYVAHIKQLPPTLR